MLGVIWICVRMSKSKSLRWPNKSGNQGMEFEVVWHTCRRSKATLVRGIELLQVLIARLRVEEVCVFFYFLAGGGDGLKCPSDAVDIL